MLCVISLIVDVKRHLFSALSKRGYVSEGKCQSTPIRIEKKNQRPLDDNIF
jgi:hypothetical protein